MSSYTVHLLLCTEQLLLTLITILSLLSINPDELKLNAAQELNAFPVKMPAMVS